MRALPRRRRRLVTIASLVWNAKANHPSQADRVTSHLDRWLRKHPQVRRISLTEVKGCWDELDRWCRRNGWTHLQEYGDWRDPRDERGDTAVLVRTTGKDAIKVRRDRVKVMRKPWKVFDHDQPKGPRRHRHTVLRVDRARIRAATHHWPTRGNGEAWRESLDAAARFLRRGRSLLDGDQNATYDEISALADDLACHVKGRQPDWTLTTGRVLNRTLLDKGDSDHHAQVVTVRL